MDFATTYNQMASDPEFAKLSYQDQISVRSALFNESVAADPELSKFGESDLRKIYTSAVYAPPALTNPQLSEQFNKMIAGVDAGDTANTDKYWAMNNALWMANNGSFFSGLGTNIVAAGSRMMAQPGDDQLGVGVVGTPDEAKIWQYMNVRDALGETASMDDGTKNLRSVLGFTMALADWIPFSAAATSIVKGGVMLGAKLGVAGLGTLGGAASEIAMPMLAAKGLTEVIAASPKMMQMANVARTWGAKTLAETILPNVIGGAAVSATIGNMAMSALSQLNENPELNPYSSVGNFATNFGIGVALDVATGMATRHILPGLAAKLKGMSIQLPGLSRKVDQADFSQATKNLAETLGVEPTQINLQSSYQRAHIDYSARLASIGDKLPTQMTDEDRLYMGTHLTSRDITIGRTDDGGYDIYGYLNPGKDISELTHKYAPTLADANDIVSNELLRRMNIDPNGKYGMPAYLAQLNKDIPDDAKRYGLWLFNWQAARTMPSRLAAELSGKADDTKYLQVANRPWISYDELSAIQANPKSPDLITPIPIRTALGEDNTARLLAGKQAFTYSDISTPFTNAGSEGNAVILANKIVDVPLEQWNLSQGQLGVSLRLGTAAEAGADTVRLIKADGSIAGYVPLAPDNIKILVPEVNASGKIPAKGTRLAAPAGVSTRDSMFGGISAHINTEISYRNIGANPSLLAQYAIQKFSGNLRTDELQLFVKSLIARSDIPINVRYSPLENAVTGGRSVELKHTTDGIDLYVPSKLSSPEAVLQFTRQLTSDLSKLKLKGTNGLPASLSPDQLNAYAYKMDISHPFFKVLESGDKTQRIANFEMMKRILDTELKAELRDLGNGQFSTTLGGQTITGPLSEIWRQVKPAMLSPVTVTNALAERGIKLKRTGDNLTATTLDGKKMIYGSYSEAAIMNGLDTNKLPAKYRPQFVETNATDDGVHISADMATIKMTPKDALKFLSGFNDANSPQAIELIKAKGGIASLIEHPDRITLKDSATNSSLSFASIDEARDFAKNTMHTFEGARRIADSKGLELDYNRGSYVVRAFDRQKHSFASLDDARAYMANYPTRDLDATESIPGLADTLGMLPRDILRKWNSFDTKLNPVSTDILNSFDDFTPDGNTRLSQTWANNMATFKAAFGKMVNGGLVPPELQQAVNRIIAASEAQSAEVFKFRNLVSSIVSGRVEGKGADAVWVRDTVKGKPMTRDRAEVIYHHMSARDNIELAKISQDMPLRRGEAEVIQDLRNLLGNKTDTGMTGFHAKFEVPYDKWQYEYMPRLVDAVSANNGTIDKLRRARSSEEVFTSLRADSANDLSLKPVELSFELSRKSELTDAMYDRNAISTILRYGEMGLRKFWLDIPRRELNNVTKILGSAGKLNPQLETLLTRFSEVITGRRGESGSERVFKDIGRGAYRAFGNMMAQVAKVPGIGHSIDPEYYKSLEFQERGSKLADNFLALSYTTFLGFRPFAALRNTFQVDSLFAPMFGHAPTNKAVQWYLNASKAEIEPLVKRLVGSDTLTGVHSFFDVEGAGSVINRVNDKALYLFKNADDLTRFIGYTAASNRFTDAISKLGKGVFGTDDAGKKAFIKYSKLSMFQNYEPALVDNIWNQVTKPEALAAARRIKPGTLFDDSLELRDPMHQFSKAAVDLTMFNYSAWNKPMVVTSGGIGRLFGQLGGYTAGYRNYMMQAFRNLDKSEFASFATNFVLTNVALYTAFKGAGIRTNDFTPILPGFIGVGPMYEAMTEGILGMTGGDLSSSAARKYSFIVDEKQPSLHYGDTTIKQPGTIRFNIPEAISPVKWRAQPSLKMGNTNIAMPDQPSFNYPQLLPGSMQYYYGTKAAEYFQKGGFDNWYRGALSILSASVDGDNQNDLSVQLPGHKVTISGGSPTQLVSSFAGQVQQMRQSPPARLAPWQ